MKNLEIVPKKILQIGHNKRFAFLTIDENRNIILKILPLILKNLSINEAKILRDEKFIDFVLDFYYPLSEYQEINLLKMEMIIYNINDFLAQNYDKNIDIESYIKYIFETRTLN